MVRSRSSTVPGGGALLRVLRYPNTALGPMRPMIEGRCPRLARHGEKVLHQALAELGRKPLREVEPPASLLRIISFGGSVQDVAQGRRQRLAKDEPGLVRSASSPRSRNIGFVGCVTVICHSQAVICSSRAFSASPSGDFEPSPP